MKQANNNEMDLLLRSLARRESNRSFLADSLAEDHEHSAHLDADELSAYAERTLPAATRARYTMHLADCAQCRRIVAELAPVVAASAREHADEREATSFGQTIRQLFSWPVLRFAVPALSLLAFLVVGLVVFRESRQGMVARSPEPTVRQDDLAQTSPAVAEPHKSEISEPQKRETLADSTDDSPTEQAKAKSPAETSAARSDATSPADAPVVNLSKDAREARPTPSAAQPTYAPEPAAAAPKAQDQVAEVRREAAQTEAAARPQSTQTHDKRATDSAERYSERAKEEEKARAKAEDKDSQVATVAQNAAPDQARGARLRTLGAGRGESAGKKDDDEARETRSVAGRRFRRQEGMWVDTAYKSGISLTHVARGSEQYRALIADEPSIRSVAEQLPGEVILIWKGRGYRIR